MNIRILYLNILYLMGTCYMASVPQIFLPLIKKKAVKRGNDYYLLCCCGVYLVFLLMGVLVVSKPNIQFSFKHSWWVVVSMITPIILIFGEYLIGMLAMILEGKKVKGFSIITSWKNISIIGFCSTLLLAVFEELMYREIWANILIHNLGLNEWLFVIISSCFYAMNHIYFGYKIYIQKFFAGCVFSILYLVSGYCILVPLTAHFIQNLIILSIGRSKGKCTK